MAARNEQLVRVEGSMNAHAKTLPSRSLIGLPDFTSSLSRSAISKRKSSDSSLNWLVERTSLPFHAWASLLKKGEAMVVYVTVMVGMFGERFFGERFGRWVHVRFDRNPLRAGSPTSSQ